MPSCARKHLLARSTEPSTRITTIPPAAADRSKSLPLATKSFVRSVTNVVTSVTSPRRRSPRSRPADSRPSRVSMSRTRHPPPAPLAGETYPRAPIAAAPRGATSCDWPCRVERRPPRPTKSRECAATQLGLTTLHPQPRGRTSRQHPVVVGLGVRREHDGVAAPAVSGAGAKPC
jgi:hypothetical protein